jgi:hypothetical protein
MPFNPGEYSFLLDSCASHYQRIVYALKCRRERLGISEEEMAEKFDVSVADIVAFESVENTERGGCWLFLYAAALGTTLDLIALPGEPAEPVPSLLTQWLNTPPQA